MKKIYRASSILMYEKDTAFRAFPKTLYPRGSPFGQRSFWLLAAFSLGHRALRPCSLAQALPKAKNPRSARVQNFRKGSRFDCDWHECGDDVGAGQWLRGGSYLEPPVPADVCRPRPADSGAPIRGGGRL